MADYIEKIAVKNAGPGVRCQIKRVERCTTACSRAFRHRILGGIFGVLAGTTFYDAARSAVQDYGAKIQSARAHGHLRGLWGMGGASTAIYPEHLPGGYQIFCPNTGADLGH